MGKVLSPPEQSQSSAPKREKFILQHKLREREREIADQMEAFDIESVRRDADDFASLSASNSESLFRECVQSLEAQVEQIVSEYSDVQFLKENDLSLCLEQLTAELKTTEAENGDLCNEIEELK